jgi:hypothetical protein
MADLRTVALNLLRLAGFHSIREGLQEVMHDIMAQLAMAMSQPEPNPSSNFESALSPQSTASSNSSLLVHSPP